MTLTAGGHRYLENADIREAHWPERRKTVVYVTSFREIFISSTEFSWKCQVIKPISGVSAMPGTMLKICFSRTCNVVIHDGSRYALAGKIATVAFLISSRSCSCGATGISIGSCRHFVLFLIHHKFGGCDAGVSRNHPAN